MPISRASARDLIMAGLLMSPEERAKAFAEAAASLAAKAAEERAKYDALTPQGRADYDALTEGMMPRLAKRAL